MRVVLPALLGPTTPQSRPAYLETEIIQCNGIFEKDHQIFYFEHVHAYSGFTVYSFGILIFVNVSYLSEPK